MNDERYNQIDQATSDRLAKLSDCPVDTTNLEHRLNNILPDQNSTNTIPLTQRMWWKPVTSAAATIILGITLMWLIFNGDSNPVMAAPMHMAEIHNEVVSEHADHFKVTSIEEANQLLSNQSNGVVSVPKLPGTIKSCCLHKYQHVTLTCALILENGELVSIAIAEANKMHTPKGENISLNGKTFVAHTMNDLQMVMTYRNGRWLCVMGKIQKDKLVKIADTIEF